MPRRVGRDRVGHVMSHLQHGLDNSARLVSGWKYSLAFLRRIRSDSQHQCEDDHVPRLSSFFSHGQKVSPAGFASHTTQGSAALFSTISSSTCRKPIRCRIDGAVLTPTSSTSHTCVRRQCRRHSCGCSSRHRECHPKSGNKRDDGDQKIWRRRRQND